MGGCSTTHRCVAQSGWLLKRSPLGHWALQRSFKRLGELLIFLLKAVGGEKAPGGSLMALLEQTSPDANESACSSNGSHLNVLHCICSFCRSGGGLKFGDRTLKVNRRRALVLIIAGRD